MDNSAAKLKTTAVVQEVFSGIQGEGMLVGLRQIFVRFHGCHLACAYCDTPASHADAPATCAVERAAASRDLLHIANPVSAPDLLAAIQRLQVGYPHHSVSLTGGEPLLHDRFLDHFLPALHAAGLRSMLETNGMLSDAMETLDVAPHYIAMDMKLPSTAGMAPQWERHAAFLDAALLRLSSDQCMLTLQERLQVKLVFGEDSLEEIESAAEIIAACDTAIPCILQPVTAHPDGPDAPGVATVLEAQRLAAGILTHVRVIPQTHVMLKQW